MDNLSYTSRPGNQTNNFSVANSYSDNKQAYFIDETINGNIVITPPVDIKNIATVELPSKSNGINLLDGFTNACVITDKNNKSYRNNGSCIGNSRTQYAPINYFTPVATLTQSLSDGTKIQPNNDNISISMTLDKFASINQNNVVNTNVSNVSNVNNMVELNVDKSAMDAAKENVVKEEIVSNVQKNTETVVKENISDNVDKVEAFTVSKSVGSDVASHVESVLGLNNLPNVNSSPDEIAELVRTCVFTKLKQVYGSGNEDIAYDSAVKVTNQTMADIDPAKYKLLIEIATNQLNTNEDVKKVASTIGKELVDSDSKVENNGKSTLITNVDVDKVVNNVKSVISGNNGITDAIKNVKNALEPEVFVIRGPGNKVTIMAQGNNVLSKTNEKIVKQVVNKVVEQISPEPFGQYPIEFTDLSNNVTVLDRQQNNINLNGLVANIIEHLVDADGAKIVTPLEKQDKTGEQVIQAAVSVEKTENKVTIVPQMDTCNCSNDQLKELCKKITLDTDAKKVEVTVTPEEVKPIVITVEKPAVSVESTIKTTLDAVNEQVSKTTTSKPITVTSTSKPVEAKENNSFSMVDMLIAVIFMYLLYSFLMKKR